MMKKILLLAVISFAMLSLLAADSAASGKEKLPTISAEVEVSKYVSATECYVLFLAESSGENLLDVKTKLDLKLNNFMELVHKDFPDSKLDVISVNIGTRDFSSYSAEQNPFSPDIAKVLLCTLPPDETMAIKLLDAGVKSGLTPFCGTSRDGTFGAVFYGLKDADAEIDNLYPQTVQKLQAQANRLSRELGREIVRMDDISRYYHPGDELYELRSKGIRVTLPSEFCASDKNKISVWLTLRANFIVKEKKPGK